MSVRPVRPVRRGSLIAALLATGLLLTGCSGLTGTTDHADNVGSAPDGTAAKDKAAGATGGAAGQSAPKPQIVEPEEIPELGPATRAEISPQASQAVVVTGTARDSSTSSVVVYERDPVTGWHAVSDVWPAHNAVRGWTDDHFQGDLRSPIGVFDLTDAGGKLPDPGTKLPYDRASAFEASGDGFEGEALAGSFDYVVAINYNRLPGTTPLDWTRPLGEDKGGGIWLHVDHGGPTQGCVSLPRWRMKELLRMLDPAKRPVVVMGDADSLGD
ncbi:L,D-transpeptidase family protein [Streptomyces scopuliridis]|uniref:L,D-transpeptidase family protein n=1 Tax=Streptomyces scopuliridis TaxID=452529 RepID=UPI0035DF523F